MAEHYHVRVWNRNANDGERPYLDILYMAHAEAVEAGTSSKAGDWTTLDTCRDAGCWAAEQTVPCAGCGHARTDHVTSHDEPPDTCWAFLSTDVNDYCPCDAFQAAPVSDVGGPAGGVRDDR